MWEILITSNNLQDVLLSSLDSCTSPSSSEVGSLLGKNKILMIVMGQFLQKKRADRRKPLSGVMLQMRLNEIADLYERVQSLMHNCPEVLKLDVDSDSKSVTYVIYLGKRADLMGSSISEDWDIHASADIQNLFFDPKAPKAIVRDAFLVQQGNIYVTQVRLRCPLR